MIIPSSQSHPGRHCCNHQLKPPAGSRHQEDPLAPNLVQVWFKMPMGLEQWPTAGSGWWDCEF
jgi:hypothetical protein